MLPPDEQAHGFDTNADALSVVPALLDRYLTAAAKISRLALGDPDDSARVRALHRRQEQLERTDVAVADRAAGRRVPVGLARRDCRAPLLSGRRRVCLQGPARQNLHGHGSWPERAERNRDSASTASGSDSSRSAASQSCGRRPRATKARIRSLPPTTDWKCAFR